MKDLFTRNRFISLTVIVLLLAGWEVVSRVTGARQILPGPADSIEALFRLCGEPGFLRSLGSTILRGLLGFALAFGCALVIGILSGLYSAVEAGFRPVIVLFRSVPVISVILLALIWFRVEQVPVFIGFLTMFPLLSTNLTQGIRQTDRSLIEMARLYQVSAWRILREVYIPSILPYLFSGISSAMGFGWRAVIIGEVLSQPRYGIGSMMQEAQSFLLVAELIAWTLIAVVIGYLFEGINRILESKNVRWNR
ncbi:MAG: ABC transporter permease [Bacteroidales bacterium]